MKKRKFEEGGYTDSEDFKNLESAALRETVESQGFKMPTRSGPPKPTVGEMPKNTLTEVGGGKESGTIERAKPSGGKESGTIERAKPKSFSQAFAAARRAGDKTFMFGGKKYTTELKEEAAKKPAPTPARRASASPKDNLYFGRTVEQRSASLKAKGGAIKMAKGGSVKSSASKRADGCAVRGKTKGRMV